MARFQLLTRSLFFLMLGLALLASGPLQAQDTLTKEKPAAAKQQDNGQQDQASDKSAKASNKSAKASKSKPSKSKKRPKITVAEIKISGIYSEGPTAESLFGDDSAELARLLKRLRKTKDDSKLRSVLLQLKGVGLGRGQLNEIRQAISEVRGSGKTVYANMEMGMPSDYLVASACDKIMMPESGMLLLPGVRAEVAFYKNMLDKLDVQADMLQVGDYKGAAEPMTRSEMSKPFRKQLETVLSDYYDQMVEMIAEDRSLAKAAAKRAIDQGILTAEAAQEAGLIDIVDYEQAWEKQLLAGSKNHELAVIKNYGKKKVDTDFSGMSGFIKMMELLSGGRKSKPKTKEADTIAIVYAVGAITSGESSNNPFGGGSTMGSDTIVKALATADKDDKVAAIVLRVDSPGGSALASDMIWNKIQEIDKPVIASMGNVAGSGGYYISMGCDKILAEPGTLTGSIGVVGGKLVLGGLMDKVGITTDVIAYGKNSGLFSPNEPFDDEGREILQKYMDETYQQFTEKAAAGRGMDVDDLLKLAGGRVWTGRQAAENGLVDEVGTLTDAIKLAQKMGKVRAKDEPNLLILPEQKTFFEELFGGNAAASPSAIRLLPEPLQAHVGELESLERILREPAVYLMPYRIEIK